MESFTDIYVLNLHGSSKKQEVCPDGAKDENIFDITVGVAITLFVKEPGKTDCRVHYADLWGGVRANMKPSGKRRWTLFVGKRSRRALRISFSCRNNSSRAVNTRMAGA